MGKQAIPIEKMLHWAYRDELPKQTIGGLTGWERQILLLGTRVDTSYTGDPGFPVTLGAPHPDALLLDHAVRSLDDVSIRWPEARETLMGELGVYLADDDPLVARMRVQTSALVQAHARMGTRPRWDVGPLRLQRIIGRNGKPVVHGVTRSGRYNVGAHAPLRLDPPPQEIVSARLEWFVWRAALEQLVRMSGGWTETKFAPQQPDNIPWRPWLTGEQMPRIHAVTTSAKMAKLLLKPQRPITEPQASWPLAGPVLSVKE